MSKLTGSCAKQKQNYYFLLQFVLFSDCRQLKQINQLTCFQPGSLMKGNKQEKRTYLLIYGTYY